MRGGQSDSLLGSQPAKAEGYRPSAYEPGVRRRWVAKELQSFDAGWSSLVARRAHNPKVVGSNPAPATNNRTRQYGGFFVTALNLAKFYPRR